MSIEFDKVSSKVLDFGVGVETEANGRDFLHVVVDKGVHKELTKMLDATYTTVLGSNARQYDPGEKYSTEDVVYVNVSDELVSLMRDLHESTNLPTNAKVMKKPEEIFAYFARFEDAKHRRVTAVRRATQFKDLRSPILEFLTDGLKIVERQLFKLDRDFDLLVMDKHLYAIRPAALESTCQLTEAIKAAVPANIKVLEKSLTYIDFGPIEQYARKHARAARYLAALKVQAKLSDVAKDNLLALCRQHGVTVEEKGNSLVVSEDHVLMFLEVLDRRMYQIELIPGERENYRAQSRRKVEMS